jgi:hypothetical protein
MTIQDFDYCKIISDHFNPVLTVKPISKYTINEVWDSVTQIISTMYTYPFSVDMKRLFYALFFRYCDILCTEQDDCDSVFDNPVFVKYDKSYRDHMAIFNQYVDGSECGDDNDDDDDDDDENDEHGLYDQYNAYKRVTNKVSNHISLRAEYVFEGEAIFKSPLYRFLLIETLNNQYKENPLCIDLLMSKEMFTVCVKSWHEMIIGISKHKVLRKYVSEHFKRHVMDLYIYHGEKERFRRAYPSSLDRATDVLQMLRPSDHIEAIRIQQGSTIHLPDEYVKDIEETSTSSTFIKLYEKECILLTRISSYLWFSYNGFSGTPKMNSQFMTDELMTLDEINEIIRLPKTSKEKIQNSTKRREMKEKCQYPYLIKIMMTYFVIDPIRLLSSEGGKMVVYKSQSPILAYLVWVSLYHLYGFIEEEMIHPSIKNLILFITQNIKKEYIQ